MKKFLLLSAFIPAFMALNAAESPQYSVRVLPQPYGYFDAFVVTWAENPTEPYLLKILDDKGISVVKNGEEDLSVAVGLTEYQETEESKNYPDSRLVVTLLMFETEIGASYTLSVPAGAVEIALSNSESVPNDEIIYSFTLQANDEIVTLPEPNLEPAQGEVTDLSEIKISWTGKLGTLDLLNENNKVNPSADIAPIYGTYNGKDLENLEVSFDWSSRKAITEGSAGDILVINLTGELQPGEYTITIPEGYLQITDIETGTLYNDEIVLNYLLTSEDSGAVSSIEYEKEGKNIIYDLNGVKVNSNELKLLPKGIYIINGKKVRN